MSPKSTAIDPSHTLCEKQNEHPAQHCAGPRFWCLYATQRGEQIFVVSVVAGAVSGAVRHPVVRSVVPSVARVVVVVVVKNRQ